MINVVVGIVVLFLIAILCSKPPSQVIFEKFIKEKRKITYADWVKFQTESKILGVPFLLAAKILVIFGIAFALITKNWIPLIISGVGALTLLSHIHSKKMAKKESYASDHHHPAQSS